MTRKQGKPSELELQVLSVLWDRGPVTVREVLAAMPDGKRRAYTTVLSVLQVMEKKHLVTHERRGQAYVYQAAVKRRQVLRPMVRNMLTNVFGGSQVEALQYLLSETKVSDEELAAMRRLIEESSESDKG